MINKEDLNPDCTKCQGTGMYQYDDNHSTVCNECCPHNKGYWLLEEHYGDNNGRWCCLVGCGHLLNEKIGKYYERFGRLPPKELMEEPLK